MKIGEFRLPNNVILAPMAGVTDLPFRKLCRTLGVGLVVGEMTSSSPQLKATRKSLLRGVHLEEPEPRSVQIVGWDPRMMAESARYNVDQGASIVDINMGCPAKKVCRKLAGSALLGDEVQVGRILESVVKAVSAPVTLKIRTGLDPAHRNAVSISRLAESCGIQALAIHGRTRACLYKGKAEFDTIRRVKEAVSIPVIANGDITTVEEARRVIDLTGVDAIMIGRGAHGAPWIPGGIARSLRYSSQVSSLTLESQRRIVIGHLNEIYSFYGAFQGVRIARKHIKWYVAAYPDLADFRRTVIRADSPGQQCNLISDFYFNLQDALKAA